MRRILLALIVLAALPPPALPQWGRSAECRPGRGRARPGPVGPDEPDDAFGRPAAVQRTQFIGAAAVPDGWRASTQHAGCWLYYLGGLVRLGYDGSDGSYWLMDPARNVWGTRIPELPGEVRAFAQEPLPDWMTNGVDSSKLGGKERITVNGREVARDAGLELLGKAGTPSDIPDDGKKLRISFIGEASATVMADWRTHPAFASLRSVMVAQDYPAADWAVRPGFVSTGKPTIYLQRPNGKVLLRLDRYEGPEQLSAALRKADPSYDPAKDPDLKPKPAPSPAPLTPGPLAPGSIEISDTLLAAIVAGLLTLGGLAWVARRNASAE